MKYHLIVVFALLGCAVGQFGQFFGAPSNLINPIQQFSPQISVQRQPQIYSGPVVAIRSLFRESFPDGRYRWSYESDNGIAAEESGTPDAAGKVVEGKYSYTSPEGNPVSVEYKADKDGYHAKTLLKSIPNNG